MQLPKTGILEVGWTQGGGALSAFPQTEEDVNHKERNGNFEYYGWMCVCVFLEICFNQMLTMKVTRGPGLGLEEGYTCALFATSFGGGE